MRPEVKRWYARATTRAQDWPVERLVALKPPGARVSVVVPALDEEATVAGVVRVVVRLAETTGLVDEVVVIDSGSTDGTARVAGAAGAVVHRAADVLPETGTWPGKGEAMWKGLAVTDGDLVVFVDADLLAPRPELVTGLLGPLLADARVQLVKGCYDRPLAGVDGTSGGRVTELVARPLLGALVPDLAGVVQPLAGESAARRSLLEQLPFPSGYGVEVGLLVDAVRCGGLDALAQVDLGVRAHRHQGTAALGRMAAQVQAALLARAGGVHAPDGDRRAGELVQFERGEDGRWLPRSRALPVAERPPLVTVPAYRAARAA